MAFPAIQYAPYTPPAGISLVWQYTYLGYITSSGTIIRTPSSGKSTFLHSLNGAITVVNANAATAAVTVRIVDTEGDYFVELPVFLPASTTVNAQFSAVPDILLAADSVLTAKLKANVAGVSISDGSVQTYYAEV